MRGKPEKQKPGWTESLIPASRPLNFVLHFKVFALIKCAILSKSSELFWVSNQRITRFTWKQLFSNELWAAGLNFPKKSQFLKKILATWGAKQSYLQAGSKFPKLQRHLWGSLRNPDPEVWAGAQDLPFEQTSGVIFIQLFWEPYFGKPCPKNLWNIPWKPPKQVICKLSSGSDIPWIY